MTGGQRVYSYDATLSHVPIPTVEVEIRSPTQPEKVLLVRMVLDTGADMTCVPKTVVSGMGRLRRNTISAVSYAGRIAEHVTSYLHITFDGNQYPFVEAIEISGEVGYLGRDVLNHNKITLDGPHLVWQCGI